MSFNNESFSKVEKEVEEKLVSKKPAKDASLIKSASFKDASFDDMMIDRPQALSRALNRSKASLKSQKSRKELLNELDAQSVKAESTKRPVEAADVDIEMKE